jgi:hypothetical protein
MSDTSNFGFAKLVPGFDFLQNLAKSASAGLPQMPNLANWIAPTLNVEELDKRIGELKAVHFWLDQNGKALAATIQALEVQKMTLATLQGMNFQVGDIADALKLKPIPPAAAAAPKEKPAEPAKNKAGPSGNGQAGAAPVDPLQWWGALTQQFQEIAANAMKDVAQRTADTARAGASAAAKAAKPASDSKKAAPAAKKSARKAPARKPRSKTAG